MLTNGKVMALLAINPHPDLIPCTLKKMGFPAFSKHYIMPLQLPASFKDRLITQILTNYMWPLESYLIRENVLQDVEIYKVLERNWDYFGHLR